MRLKEEISQAIQTMNRDELVLLYELIRWLLQSRTMPAKPARAVPLEQIHQLTSSSKDSWAKLIIEERAERL